MPATASAARHRGPAAPPAPRSTLRKLRTAAITAGICIVVGALGFYALARYVNLPLPFISDTCRIYGDGESVKIKPSQLEQAATITAVGARMGIGEDGIAVALATAYQESKLENLSSGDRDSVGLFQQRPSQGWGTVEQLHDPRFASERFFEELLNIQGWQEMRITEAAQAVQRSAHPEAYQQWAAQAQTSAAGLYGGEKSAVTCKLRRSGGMSGEKAADSLRQEFALDHSSMATAKSQDGDASVLTAAVPAASVESRPVSGWRAAHWFVAHSRHYGVRQVTYEGSTWKATLGNGSRIFE